MEKKGEEKKLWPRKIFYKKKYGREPGGANDLLKKGVGQRTSLAKKKAGDYGLGDFYDLRSWLLLVPAKAKMKERWCYFL